MKTKIFFGLVCVVFFWLYQNQEARAASADAAALGACSGADASQIIQTALNNLNSGDTLTVSCQVAIGSLGISLKNKSNVSVAGVNGGGFKSLAASGQSVPGFSGVMFLIENCTNCTIKDLQWEGNNVSAAAFGFNNTQNCTFSGNTIRNAAYPANAAVVGVNNRSNTYSGNTVQNTGAGTYNGTPDGTRGLWLGNVGADKNEFNPIITNNILTGIAATGIAVVGVAPVITGNTVTDTQGSGIKWVRGEADSQAVIDNNTVKRNAFHGLQIGDSPGTVFSALIRNNTVSENSQAGIYLPVIMQNSEISGNIVADNHKSGAGGWHAGIMVFNTVSLAVKDNQVHNSQGNQSQDIGILVNALGGQTVSGLSISNNVISNHAIHGIAVMNDQGNISGIQISGNTITGSKNYGLDIYQKTSGVISGISLSGNCFSGNGQGALSDVNRGSNTLAALSQSSSCTSQTASPPPASTGTPAQGALISVLSTGEAFNQHGGWVGFKFTVGSQPLYVTALGRMILAGNSQNHKVKLVLAPQSTVQTDASEKLAEVLITSQGKTAGQIAYENLSQAIKLEAGGVYYLVSEEFYNGDMFNIALRGNSTKLSATAVTITSAIYWWAGDPYWRTEGSGNNSNGILDLKFSFTAPAAAPPPAPLPSPSSPAPAATSTPPAGGLAFPANPATSSPGSLAMPPASSQNTNNPTSAGGGSAAAGAGSTAASGASGGSGSTNSSAGGGGSSGGGGGGGSAGSSGGGGSPGSSTIQTSPPAVSLKLVNDRGTFYVIKDGKKQGVTNPGMLFSYGLDFKDAKTASAQEQSLPASGILLPSDGALVKSKEDQTVYLISQGKRFAFVSQAVFSRLGYKFSSVLTVTNPELQALPKAADLDDSEKAHLPGTDIVHNGTIYWINPNGSLNAYPSLAVYNSWHRANDFSTVVPANSEDLKLPIGELVGLRVKE